MFEIGAKIRFKYTGMLAEIIENHQDGSYTVWLEEEQEDGIAFEDDIVLDRNFKAIEQSEQQKTVKKKKKIKGPSTEDLFYSKAELDHKKRAALQPKNKKSLIVTSNKQDAIDEDTFVPTPIFQQVPSNKGCYLAFHQTSNSSYTIYLVNDTLTSFSFEFKLFLNQQLEHGFNKVIPANTFFAIGELLQAQFNDAPYINFVCPKFEFKKVIKLKYLKFLRTKQAIPLMGLETYGFLLFDKLNPYLKKNHSIKDYTSNHKREQSHLMAPVNRLYRSFDLMDVASFEQELDLHAEKLVNDTSEFTPRELYDLQLQVLEDFMNTAIEFGLKEVFIIHGLGKGKLKQGVDDFLRFHGDVKTYKNEFHEKYGFGATRVLLKK
ncbi:MAG: Smr protein/MutS2 [uncultured Aureispira sp.]|uniref:Smr protein/MutS2 n=1 Tax=uncultured Aureispira sp. TaxID=1331704 RepID=A0A6S6RT37_9BACT|nr:MAG: Smr protein/MutS2 [uncultured Aureispira sp.]